jgi:hypothetical protein
MMIIRWNKSFYSSDVEFHSAAVHRGEETSQRTTARPVLGNPFVGRTHGKSWPTDRHGWAYPHAEFRFGCRRGAWRCNNARRRESNIRPRWGVIAVYGDAIMPDGVRATFDDGQ